jgi:hypothetical protein
MSKSQFTDSAADSNESAAVSRLSQASVRNFQMQLASLLADRPASGPAAHFASPFDPSQTTGDNALAELFTVHR